MVNKWIKTAAVAALVAGVAGCSHTHEELQAQIDEAMRLAQSAQSTAQSAQSTAQSAQQAAQSAQAAAQEAKACCQANSQRIERMFEASMRK